MNKNDLTDPIKFATVIRGVIDNDRQEVLISVKCPINFRYRKNAIRISQMLKNKPFSVRELIVKYTEFAAEFGPSKALRPQSHDMSWIEYHNVVSC